MKDPGTVGRKMKQNRQSGFSLIELMVAILILMVIMAAVFTQIDEVQKRFRSEETKVDIFQTAREFIDQMTRDIHQAGYPNGKMFADGGTATGYQNANNAIGIYYITKNEVRFQGDVDGDGQVDFVAYKLFPQSATPGDQNCPCLRRSQLLKQVAMVDPMTQAPDWRTQVENVSTTGVNGDNIFIPYDKFGAVVALGTTGLTKFNFYPKDDGVTAGLTPLAPDPINKIWSVQIQLNVQASVGDIGTQTKPHVFLTATAQVNN